MACDAYTGGDIEPDLGDVDVVTAADLEEFEERVLVAVREGQVTQGEFEQFRQEIRQEIQEGVLTQEELQRIMAATIREGVAVLEPQGVVPAAASEMAVVPGRRGTVGQPPLIVINGTVATGLNPQPDITHPSLYLPTGVGGHQVWTIEAPTGSVIIAGGVVVNGIEGHYRAWRSDGTPVVLNVTDGFALVTTSEWGEQEFCFRVGQAIEQGWLLEVVNPLSGWRCGAVDYTRYTP
ncbi:MAG: hypothetical protein ACOX6V_02705 [Patescibacteria group bacterium]